MRATATATATLALEPGETWQKHAACRRLPPKAADRFFDARYAEYVRRTYCDTCPVLSLCKGDARRGTTTTGVWGGAYHRHSRPLSRPPVCATPGCGTELEDARRRYCTTHLTARTTTPNARRTP